jgi:tetratricopeptide (TPR) repeat protein
MASTESGNRWKLRRSHGIAALIAVLAVVGLGIWFRAPALGNRPLRILLVAPPPEAEDEMSHYQARAIALLIQDVLEAKPEIAVTLISEMPAKLEHLRPGTEWLLIKTLPRRRQDRLGLTLEWLKSGQARKGALDWQRKEVSLGPPELVLAQAMEGLPVKVSAAVVKALFPATGKGFWNLIQASTLRLQNADLPLAQSLAESLTKQEPRCAEAWWLLGNLKYRALLSEPSRSEPGNLQETSDCVRQGEDLVPRHPRGVFLRAQLLTNSGSHRESLELLLEGLRTHPRSLLLLSGLVYAARNAGLLDLAKQCAERRDRWSFPETQALSIDVLFLYLNDWPRFEITLKDQPGHLRNTIQRFYRGYLALLRSRSAEAIEAFRAAESVPRGYPHYIHLARSYRLAVEGSREAAIAELRTLDRERYALAGDLDSAMEVAGRAFGQGFGATIWYERSPLLEPLRSSPRWNTLMQHVKERQQLLEARFPVDSLPAE